MELVSWKIRAGRWQGVISSGQSDPPQLEVIHLERPLEGLTVSPASGADGTWTAEVQLPPDLLSDGVQTFLVRDIAGAASLGHFSIVTGAPVEEDLRAEIDLLRAELDMLKKAFRRHCIETGG